MNGLSKAFPNIARQALSNTTTKQLQYLLNYYGSIQSSAKTKQLHSIFITGGLFCCNLRCSLVSSYALCGHVLYARKLFDILPQRSVFTYNTVIRMYVRYSMWFDAINVFVKMIGDPGACYPDSYTYPCVVKACSKLKLVKAGLVLHGMAMRSGLGTGTSVQNSLLAFYMNCGKTVMARKVFDVMNDRTVVSWNTMISGYSRNGRPEESLMVFNEMMEEFAEPDSATVVSVLPVCGSLKSLEIGREVHRLVEKKGLGDIIEVKNALVDFYVKCDQMDEARFVFDRIVQKDVVTWTSMINGCILNGYLTDALRLCRLMQIDGVRPNSVTVASLLSACGSAMEFNAGKCLHGLAIRQNFYSDVILETALIDMYGKCNRVDLSYRVFARTSKTRTAPWNALLSKYVHNKLSKEAMELFNEMQANAVEPDSATMNCLLPAYAILADMHQAMHLHCYLIRSGFISSLEVATGLIDIYSKSGSLEFAHKVFNGITKRDRDKDVILWSVLVSGYGMHGGGDKAILVFEQMIQSGVRPNEITFTSVINACSHAGLVDAGLSLFKFMLENYRRSIRPNHYTCIVDLLGRADRLNEAYDLVRTMQFEPSPTIWGALLGACVIHENVDLGEVAANKLFELEPENTGNYVLLAKIYAAVGRWKDVECVRNKMNEIGLRKAAAHSLVETRCMSY